MLKDFFYGLLDLIYPHTCVVCHQPLSPGKKKTSLCQTCTHSINFNKPPFCIKCSRHMGAKKLSECKQCSKTNYHFDRAWSICEYNDSMKKLIHLFKYGNKTALRHDFSSYIVNFVMKYHISIKEYDAIIPVPLNSTRFRERGYNQAELIARPLAEKHQIPLVATAVKRIRNTNNQARLSQKERWTNILSAFTINRSYDFHQKSILIIDDLLTTGATVSEIARILKDADASRVDVLTLAIGV